MTPLLPAQTLSGVDRVHHMEFMRMCLSMPDASVDMILCDLPYGTTALRWDAVIPFEPMWKQFTRIIKPYHAIVLTASDPFTTYLKVSNMDWYKYSWVWVKTVAGEIFNAKLKPLKQHEDILVFSDGMTANGSDRNMPYYPQGLRRVQGDKTRKNTKTYRAFYNPRPSHGDTYEQEWENYPTSILEFANDANTDHPTQKPVALFEYLIRTYTQEGDIIFDPCVGSGTTARAARNTKRRYVCGEKELDYVLIARDRLRLPFEKRHTPVNDDVSDLPMFAASA